MVVVSQLTEITTLKCAHFFDGQLLLTATNATSLWTGNLPVDINPKPPQTADTNMMSD